MNKQTSQQQLPIFVINLPEGKKRRSFISKHMQQHNLKYEFFKASRGDELSQEFLSKFKIQQGTKSLGRELASPELGCIFSHYLLLKKIAAEEIPVALILEDDAKVTPDSITLINNFQHFVGDSGLLHWDILQVGYWNKFRTGAPFVGNKSYPLGLWQTKKINLPGLNTRMGPLIDETEGTHAYIVNKQGAQLLINVIEQQPILPFDVFLHSHRQHLRYYAIVPSLIFQSGNLKIEQHIRSERQLERETVSPYRPARTQTLARFKLLIHDALGKEEHPLHRLYKTMTYFKFSLSKTKRVISRPVMRKK